MGKKKEQPVTVVYACKGGLSIGRIYFAIFVHVQKTFESYDEYFWSSNGDEVDAVANKALKKSYMLESYVPCDLKYFGDITVEEDDCYENRTVASLKGDPNYNYYKVLGETKLDVEYEGVNYPCQVEICRQWFDDEEHVNKRSGI